MRFSFVLFVVALAPTIILTNAKKLSTCRESAIFKNFDITRISGHWYAYSGHYHDFEAGCDCLTAEIVVTDSDALESINCCQMTGVSNVTQKCEIGIKKATLTNPNTKEALFKFTMTGCKYTFVVEMLKLFILFFETKCEHFYVCVTMSNGLLYSHSLSLRKSHLVRIKKHIS